MERCKGIGPIFRQFVIVPGTAAAMHTRGQKSWQMKEYTK